MKIRSDSKDEFFNYKFVEACKDADISVARLSDAMGLSQPLIYAYQRLRLFPKPENALKIANYLGKSVDYLFPEKLREITQDLKEERGVPRWKKYRGSLISSVANGNIDARVKMRQLNSLNNPLSIDDVTDELIVDSDSEQSADKVFLSETLGEVFKTLTFREREVIKMRYGIGYEGHTHTFEEVGQVFRIPRERVRQIEAKAVRKLQHPFRAFKLLSFLNFKEAS